MSACVAFISRITHKHHTADLQSVALFPSYLVLVQFPGSQVQAEIWSHVSLDLDKGFCLSQTFESTKLLMIELTSCLGYFKHEDTVFRRSHSSENCEQDEDKRCVRSSIVLSKPFLYRLSTWLWWCKSRPELVCFTFSLYTFISIWGDRFSTWRIPQKNGSMPLHSVSIVNFTVECVLLSVSGS